MELWELVKKEVMTIKAITCCFSGHRDISSESFSFVINRLLTETERLINSGVKRFISGGAYGFDLYAAAVVVLLRQKYRDIQLILALPCRNHNIKWHCADIAFFNSLLSLADNVMYTSEQYYRGCMHTRNRYMVDNSAYCICYLTKDEGGTAYTVKYAKEKGLSIIYTNT